ncbi:hypothetical protein BSQ39_07070 [Loigolactobacillus backii]|uniref:hypothetical protein n=1 Tax=Loigolactobacillus backii TaxID=375175 RepID=UPI000C1CA80B|nr:hypothetical protein [Loigolactobacillus backii]PIO83330.1 hypothetical protein BSQ39_07070 [Loigolactobacillus backii]
MLVGGNLPIGTKDAILAVAVLTILVVTVIFKQSVGEFITEEIAVCVAFLGGTLKRDKRLR